MTHSDICPWWIGYLLANPIRLLFQDPKKIVGPYVNSGSKILEIGPGMGFFTIPMARMVGSAGRITTVDIQKKMLDNLKKRALKAGVNDRIEYRVCTSDSLGIGDLKESIDFVLLFAVVHEIPEVSNLFRQIYPCVKKNGIVLIAEPALHVSTRRFENEISFAKDAGFQTQTTSHIPQSHGILLKKN